MLKVVRAGDGISAVAAFARDIPRGSWFAALGEPLTESERAEARTYIAEMLGRKDIAIGGVADWLAAQTIIKRHDDHAWWDAEMLARNEARQQAETANGKDTLLAALEPIVEAAGALDGPAALAASRGGITDQALIRVAAGAAAQACHQAALAIAAGAGGDHPFAIKYRLFAGGRWPLGFDGDRFVVF
ncbi:MAG TPA: hypothetical protein VGU20_11340 [Stellaceae bacterium]|nr:hypothetical protein [Stellaceae bacterium]